MIKAVGAVLILIASTATVTLLLSDRYRTPQCPMPVHEVVRT